MWARAGIMRLARSSRAAITWGRSRMLRSLPARAAVALGLVAASVILVVPPAAFADQCSGVPDCVTVNSGEITLGRLATKSRTMGCPSNAAYAWNWAADKSSDAVTVAGAFNII